MPSIINERYDYQKFIVDYLVNNNGYVRRTNDNFDRYFAMDKELLFKFLNDTQPEKVTALKKTLKSAFDNAVVNAINNQITSKKSSLIDTLKHGIEVQNTHLDLVYPKPATSINKEANKKYSMNILSVAEEVWASDSERIDMVIFLNGFAIMSFELKANTSGQTYRDAIYQYRTERNPKDRLFLFKAGCLVNFAMDFEECYMTTRLQGESTYFLPFNRGNGEGIECGKGNPINPDGFGVSYMWEDILRKDMVIELVNKFIFVESKEKTDEVTGKTKTTENVIFPRYHQLDCIRKVLADLKDNHTDLNYLIQHSAGSGKTNTIAWLAHRLVSLHDENDNVIFNNIVIATDRIVVDRQLQKAVMNLEHKSGLIQVMNDKCTSADLKDALEGNTKIVATTIQKFPYIVESVKGLKNKKFAVIIDEAHSSTAGKEMSALTQTLGSDEEDEDISVEDMIAQEIEHNGKQSNVSMFAFTATPKAETLALFGKMNEKGMYEAFHNYSMKQAIEEGFILDVLTNYTTYETFYKINKAIEQDPMYKEKKAKKQIARFAMLHDTNIAQRVEIIIEHFRSVVKDELGGQAKAMVITGSRPEAVKYYYAFKNYTERKGITDVRPIVAFSGKVTGKQIGDADEEKVFTETSINGFSEEKTASKFDTDEYQVMLVANKYQTGFDQPKLCAMYILKKLRKVNAVQTLSRLNRTCYPYDKKTFILDFVNSYEDIEDAFDPYYTSTELSNTITPQSVYEIEAKVDSYCLFSNDDASKVNDIIYMDNPTTADKAKITAFLSKSKKKFDDLEEKDRKICRKTLRGFVRCYEFVIQVSSLEDLDLHKKYKYVCLLLNYLGKDAPGKGFNLVDKINASNFYQKKGMTHTKPEYESSYIKLVAADQFNLTEEKEARLSEIIKDINSKTGMEFNNDVAIKSALQIRDIMKSNPDLLASAKNNTQDDFALAYYSNIENALIDGLEQNQEFFTLLLKQPELQKELLGLFLSDIYKSLRKDGGK
ncbi:MAG: DEAD/DEAH box helicase family protein [Acholeplasmatales bacterium]|nr:DEAD/DEAH box helicase family protein [Acholeplasmatales bacterium]